MEQPLEELVRLLGAPLQAEVVRQPEAAGEEHALPRRQPVERLVREIALHQAVYGKTALDRLYGGHHARILRRRSEERRVGKSVGRCRESMRKKRLRQS